MVEYDIQLFYRRAKGWAMPSILISYSSRVLTASRSDDQPATSAPLTVTTTGGCAWGSSASPP